MSEGAVGQFLDDLEGTLSQVIDATLDEEEAKEARAELSRLTANAKSGIGPAEEAEAQALVPGIAWKGFDEAYEEIEPLLDFKITSDEGKPLFASLVELINRARAEDCHDAFIAPHYQSGEMEVTLHRSGIEALGEEETVIKIDEDPEELLRRIHSELPRELQQTFFLDEGNLVFILDEEVEGPDWRVELRLIPYEDDEIVSLRAHCPEMYSALVERKDRIEKLSE